MQVVKLWSWIGFVCCTVSMCGLRTQSGLTYQVSQRSVVELKLEHYLQLQIWPSSQLVGTDNHVLLCHYETIQTPQFIGLFNDTIVHKNLEV